MNNNLGLNIKTYRKNKGFTQEELAGMLGVTPQAISRWESEVGLPDVSMIVPIAQALNVTTDMLLGNDVSNHDDYLATAIKDKVDSLWDISDRHGSELKIVEYLADEANKNPMNFEISVMYVQEVAGFSYYTDMEGLLSDNQEKANAILEDGIKKGVNVIRYANKQELVDKAHYALAWIYIHRKDFENAREHINVLPSLKNNRIRECINSELVFFEKGFEDMKDSITETNKALFDVMTSQLKIVSENYAYYAEPEDAIKNLQWVENVINAYNTIPEYTTDAFKRIIKKLNHNMIIAYERAGNKEKANEICDNYLAMIKEKSYYSDEEYASIEKEFKERIYQL